MDKTVGIGKEFLKKYDSHIHSNLDSIKCFEIDDIYWEFLIELKALKGNKNGFTGLSEYLIFRFVYHYLGGDFEERPATKIVNKFVKSKYTLGQSIPIKKPNDRKCYPDIIICKSSKIKAIIQVKTYLTNGRKEIEKEMNTFEELRDLYPGLRALLLIFHQSEKGKVIETLKKYEKDLKWFKYLILERNGNLLHEELNKKIFSHNLR